MRNWLPFAATISLPALVIASLLILPPQELVSLLVYMPVLFIIALVAYRRGIRPLDPDFSPALFQLAFMARLFGALGRYWVLAGVYNSWGDAMAYHYHGSNVANALRRFNFSVLSHYTFMSEGSTRMVHLVGLLYTVLPSSLPGAFFIFAALAFVGSVFYYRAFRLALPQAPPHLYRLLIFFLPSILFWPSSPGKDGWTFFSSGLFAYGAAQYMSQKRLSGLLWAGVGLLLVNLIRPHVAFFLLAAAITAYVLVQARRTVWQFVGGAVAVILVVFLVQSLNENFASKRLPEIDMYSLDEIEAFQGEVQRRTATGGSQFDPVSPFGLMQAPYSVITVVFRPFPWEANNAQMLFTAAESTLWMGLMWYRRKTLLARLRAVMTNPWLAFALFYAIMTILSFTVFANFGIIARQRVIFLPFLLVLIG